MHIKKDLFSTHLGQTCSYSPLLKTSLQPVSILWSSEETTFSELHICVLNPLVSAKSVKRCVMFHVALLMLKYFLTLRCIYVFLQRACRNT